MIATAFLILLLNQKIIKRVDRQPKALPASLSPLPSPLLQASTFALLSSLLLPLLPNLLLPLLWLLIGLLLLLLHPPSFPTLDTNQTCRPSD